MDDHKRIRTEQIIQLGRELYLKSDWRDIRTFKEKEALMCIEMAECFFEAADTYRKSTPEDEEKGE